MFMNAFNSNSNSEKKRLRALDLDEFQNAKKRIFDGIGSLSLHDEKTSHIDRNQSTASSSSNKYTERSVIINKSNASGTLALSPRSPIYNNNQTYVNNETSAVMSIDSDINELCEDFPTLSTKKPIRKVDFLIDDLIRKSRRKYEPTLQSSEIDYDSNIPSSIGPKPTTDQILSSRYWPIIAPTPDTLFPKPNKGTSSLGVSRSDSIKKLSPLMLNLNNLSLKNTTSSQPPSTDPTDTPTGGVTHDNNKTHTEWIIEEIESSSNQYDGDTSSNSTSAGDVHTLGIDGSSKVGGGGGGVGGAHHRQCQPDACMMAVEPDEEEGEEGDTSSGESDDLGLIIP